MKKNVAGQKIGAQLVSATDGSAFTGAVTVSVTGDAGTQATGSVGSGACTHEGNGYHTYAPAQAETDYDLVAFTFTGTGAVPVTVQVYTSFPQTGDSFVRLGAPAGASVSADIADVETKVDDLETRLGTPSDFGSGATVAANLVDIEAFADNLPGIETKIDTIDDFLDTEVAAILADTNELQTDWADAGRLDLLIDAIKAKTDNLPADPADASDIAGSFTTVNTKLDTIDDFLDTEIAAIKTKTDQLTFTGANRVDANVEAINNNTDSPITLDRGARNIAIGTVGAASTTTSIVTSAMTPSGAVADQFKGRIVIFDKDTTTAALRGQATDITASSNAALPVLTVTALTTAPASGDTFTIQ